MKRTYIMPLLVLTLICFVVSGALALMHGVTEPIIVSAAVERAQAEMIVKIPDAAGFDFIDLDDFDGIPGSVKEVYRTSNDVGYIFIAAVNGFSGDITVICAVSSEGRIISCSTLSHTETKGIGTIIEQDSFLDLFIGLDSRADGVDTVTGATISTRAFIGAVEDILVAFNKLKVES